MIPHRAGFNLIELLVVVAVITLLSGMVLAVVGPLRRSAKIQRTQVVLGAVQQALGLSRADRGNLPSPAEHPLAGSYAAPGRPRAVFRRADGTALATTVSVAPGTAGEEIALTGVATTNLPAANRARLMLPDDVFADAGVPLLYGLHRDQLGILGAPQRIVTRYRRLARQATPAIVIADPDDLSQFPDERYLVASTLDPAGTKQLLDTVLGIGNGMAELTRLGALYTPPDDAPGNLLVGDRVWSDPAEAPVAAHGSKVDAGSGWRRYRLRGEGVYDPWEHEILFTVRSDGRAVLASAGPDGCFRWAPGPDGTYQTDAWATTPAGDDLDATRDNITVEAP